MTPLKHETWPVKSQMFMRDKAYLASIELAKERGAFPLFNADLYLSGDNFASRLPSEIKKQIRNMAFATHICCRLRPQERFH
jgi:ribonucleotide reductase alpha subunit